MKSVYALRIVKPPRWVSEPTAGSNGSQYRPGLQPGSVETVGHVNMEPSVDTMPDEGIAEDDPDEVASDWRKET